MIDTHCHIDLYPHPTEIAVNTDRAGILTVIVTNLPSAFDRAYPYVKGMRNIRLALGLHPLVAAQHIVERKRFTELAHNTSYIGEIGLDFSRVGVSTKALQVESFRFVLRTLQGKPKFITVHSRQAESAVLDILEEEKRSPVVFHWYSGSVRILERAVDKGHFFSVNPAMIKSQKGKKLIEAIPPDRILTESDGPFVKVGNRCVLPSDVKLVEEFLATVWQKKPSEVSTKIRENFFEIVRSIR